MRALDFRLTNEAHQPVIRALERSKKPPIVVGPTGGRYRGSGGRENQLVEEQRAGAIIRTIPDDVETGRSPGKADGA